VGRRQGVGLAVVGFHGERHAWPLYVRKQCESRGTRVDSWLMCGWTQCDVGRSERLGVSNELELLLEPEILGDLTLTPPGPVRSKRLVMK
jgi:hypothetical protein